MQSVIAIVVMVMIVSIIIVIINVNISIIIYCIIVVMVIIIVICIVVVVIAIVIAIDRLQLKRGLFWHRHHPKMHEMVSDRSSRANFDRSSQNFNACLFYSKFKK